MATATAARTSSTVASARTVISAPRPVRVGGGRWDVRDVARGGRRGGDDGFGDVARREKGIDVDDAHRSGPWPGRAGPRRPSFVRSIDKSRRRHTRHRPRDMAGTFALEVPARHSLVFGRDCRRCFSRSRRRVSSCHAPRLPTTLARAFDVARDVFRASPQGVGIRAHASPNDSSPSRAAPLRPRLRRGARIRHRDASPAVAPRVDPAHRHPQPQEPRHLPLDQHPVRDPSRDSRRQGWRRQPLPPLHHQRHHRQRERRPRRSRRPPRRPRSHRPGRRPRARQFRRRLHGPSNPRRPTRPRHVAGPLPRRLRTRSRRARRHRRALRRRSSHAQRFRDRAPTRMSPRAGSDRRRARAHPRARARGRPHARERHRASHVGVADDQRERGSFGSGRHGKTR